MRYQLGYHSAKRGQTTTILAHMRCFPDSPLLISVHYLTNAMLTFITH